MTMRVGDGIVGSKRIRCSMSDSSAVANSDDFHESKRRKPSSSTAPTKGPSEFTTMNIDDLPEAILINILCRLPSYKYVAQCKCVSKRWHTLTFDSAFIGTFLHFQMDHKQTPIVRTLINRKGEEFLDRMSSSPKPITSLFKRLMSVYNLEEEPVVVDTYNDLLLCCASEYDQRDYYICNPNTLTWVALPPPPQVCEFTAVGFMCDHPYYTCKKSDQGEETIQFNPEYKCRVVKIVFPSDEMLLCLNEFKVHIFFSETGEWRESVVSSPTAFVLDQINWSRCFAHDGMLYWMSYSDFLIGLDPFMMDNKNSASVSSTSNSKNYGHDQNADRCTCFFIDVVASEEGWLMCCHGEYSRCLQVGYHDLSTGTMHVMELNEEEVHGRAGQICFEQKKRVYLLPEELMGRHLVHIIAFDPDTDGAEGSLYVAVRNRAFDMDDIYMFNMCTEKWLKMDETRPAQYSEAFPFVLPWWPTPVPSLQKT